MRSRPDLFQERPQGIHKRSVLIKSDEVTHIRDGGNAYLGVQLANFRDDIGGYYPSKLRIGCEEQQGVCDMLDGCQPMYFLGVHPVCHDIDNRLIELLFGLAHRTQQLFGPIGMLLAVLHQQLIQRLIGQAFGPLCNRILSRLAGW